MGASLGVTERRETSFPTKAEGREDRAILDGGLSLVNTTLKTPSGRYGNNYPEEPPGI
jgi:hypothetical protein